MNESSSDPKTTSKVLVWRPGIKPFWAERLGQECYTLPLSKLIESTSESAIEINQLKRKLYGRR